MNESSELTLTLEDYDKAFTEVSFLLDMFIETFVAFVGKSTPSLAVAAGRKMAANLPVHLVDTSVDGALAEFVRVFRLQQMEFEAHLAGPKAMLSLHQCPIGAVCANRKMELGGQACQMFHYYIAGIMAELTGRPARPTTHETGEICSFSLTFGAARLPQ